MERGNAREIFAGPDSGVGQRKGKDDGREEFVKAVTNEKAALYAHSMRDGGASVKSEADAAHKEVGTSTERFAKSRRQNFQTFKTENPIGEFQS